jgi:hypothetical protein
LENLGWKPIDEIGGH